MDCRILPDIKVDDVIAASGKTASSIAEELGLTISVDLDHRQDSKNPTPADAPIVMELEKAIKQVTGLDARPMGIGGGTVAAFFREAGFPAAVWMSSAPTAHQPNEYCLISDVIKDAKVFACLYSGGL
jgi:succinyl-diaminopimelate desuccinylase